NDVWSQMCSLPVPDNPTSETLTRDVTPAHVTTWDAWRKAYPNSKVLAPVEQYSIFYEAYDSKQRGYNANPLMDMTITNRDVRLSPGEDIYGVYANGDGVVYPLATLKRLRH